MHSIAGPRGTKEDRDSFASISYMIKLAASKARSAWKGTTRFRSKLAIKFINKEFIQIEFSRDRASQQDTLEPGENIGKYLTKARHIFFNHFKKKTIIPLLLNCGYAFGSTRTKIQVG